MFNWIKDWLNRPLTPEALAEQALLNRCEEVTGPEWPTDPLFEKMTKEYMEYKEARRKEEVVALASGPQYATCSSVAHASWCTPGEVVYWAQKTRGVKL